ncbi:hypothetical protein [Arthrobacter sp. AL12]|uniref:hypothetical protein n=1 Tax=Arthrobacter sp. AL12 TaxID=3042241 RepID=UPI00249CBCCA|nr:hypothetical protein [Arthrobacter sp. AL12]MDI3213586.1 hypothetical protein [Arthrobacter sp. AL12]
MTPKLLGTALLCMGALNFLVGVIGLQNSSTSSVWVFWAMACGGVGLMLCGYFIGKRKSWD